jgi:hypothetical protein
MDNRTTGVLFFLATALILVVGLVLPFQPLARWLLILALMIATLVLIGFGVAGRVWGVLIDSRNALSLSRLQLVVWTALVLSAYLAAVLTRLAAGEPNPLAVAVPETLWWLMGISTTSLVGTPLIRSSKATRGLIVAKAAPSEARWTDLFKGEEAGNADLPDMGKIQMFYFTVIIVIAYVLALARAFQGGSPLTQLPPVDASMLALLGISHAGYLVNKGVPQRVAP